MITTVQSAVKIVTQQHEQVVQIEQEEHAAFTPYWKTPIIDDDDDEYTIQYREYIENSSNAITPDLPTKEPDNSLSLGDEHPSTILKTESDEVINSSDEDLVLIPSESEGIFDDTHNVPFCDNSPPLDVHVPNELPTHPTLMLDSDFIPSDDSLGSDLEVSFPSETRNKIFDSGIFFEVQSKIFISRDTFSISFIRNPLCPVIETLLPFSSENEDKVFNPGILSSNLLSHRGKITFDFSESPITISEGNIPFLDVLFLHFYPS
ncbi:hypothetical protein Tco_0179373 [Tanacetum coccineum]